MKLDELNIYDIGNEIQISGAIWSGKGKHFLCFFPDEDNGEPTEILKMDYEEWKRFLRQTDLLEIEILKEERGGITKAIVRKTQRIIEQGLQWRVFKRDNYTCRYCGSTGVPLTVDHLILWEEGGPSIEQNLITACKKCNKTRGNMQYSEWINSPYYEKVAKNLSDHIRYFNEEVLDYIDQIPKKVHMTSR